MRAGTGAGTAARHLAVYQLAHRVLPVDEQTALTGLFSSPGQVVGLFAPYLIGTFLVGLLVIGFALPHQPCQSAGTAA